MAVRAILTPLDLADMIAALDAALNGTAPTIRQWAGIAASARIAVADLQTLDQGFDDTPCCCCLCAAAAAAEDEGGGDEL